MEGKREAKQAEEQFGAGSLCEAQLRLPVLRQAGRPHERLELVVDSTSRHLLHNPLESKQATISQKA